jgi:hypothetical protein
MVLSLAQVLEISIYPCTFYNMHFIKLVPRCDGIQSTHINRNRTNSMADSGKGQSSDIDDGSEER